MEDTVNQVSTVCLESILGEREDGVQPVFEEIMDKCFLVLIS